MQIIDARKDLLCMSSQHQTTESKIAISFVRSFVRSTLSGKKSNEKHGRTFDDQNKHDENNNNDNQKRDHDLDTGLFRHTFHQVRAETGALRTRRL